MKGFAMSNLTYKIFAIGSFIWEKFAHKNLHSNMDGWVNNVS